MCVSGSRIACRICRSSSVSAPSMVRSIFLPLAPARSRTSRGSLPQALPTGCMRVFITASCRSVVTRLSCCTGVRYAESSSFWVSWMSWLRVSTSSPARFMSRSSTPTSTRRLWSDREPDCEAPRAFGAALGALEGEADGGSTSAAAVAVRSAWTDSASLGGTFLPVVFAVGSGRRACGPASSRARAPPLPRRASLRRRRPRPPRLWRPGRAGRGPRRRARRGPRASR